MKNLLLICIVLAMYSCAEPNVPSQETNYVISVSEKRELEIIVVDNCEYLYGSWGPGSVLTHKGNCKNPIHKTK